MVAETEGILIQVGLKVLLEQAMIGASFRIQALALLILLPHILVITFLRLERGQLCLESLPLRLCLTQPLFHLLDFSADEIHLIGIPHNRVLQPLDLMYERFNLSFQLVNGFDHLPDQHLAFRYDVLRLPAATLGHPGNIRIEIHQRTPLTWLSAFRDTETIGFSP